MSNLLALLTRAFDFLLGPFESLPPLLTVVVFSCLAGAGMLLVFRFTSDQKGIRRVKDRMAAHLLELRLFQDHPGVMLRAQGRLLRATLRYSGYSLKPLAVMLVPVTVFLVQLDARLGWLPPKPQEPILLKARFNRVVPLDQVSLVLPDGLVLTAPPVRLPAEKEAVWQLKAERAGFFMVQVSVAGTSFPKQITVATRPARVSPARGRAGFWQEFLHPGEPPLPEDAPLASVEVNHRRRRFGLGPFKPDWLVVFFVVSLVSGFALKGVLRTEV